MSQTSTLKGQCIAEFLGTGLLIFFGVGCVAALKVAGASFGQWEISVIWGLGVAMAIYLTAGFPARILIPLLPLHCGCLPVSTSAKLFLLSFHKLPALSALRL